MCPWCEIYSIVSSRTEGNWVPTLTNISGWSLTKNLFLLKLSFLILALQKDKPTPLVGTPLSLISRTHGVWSCELLYPHAMLKCLLSFNVPPWKCVDFGSMLENLNPHISCCKVKVHMVFILKQNHIGITMYWNRYVHTALHTHQAVHKIMEAMHTVQCAKNNNGSQHILNNKVVSNGMHFQFLYANFSSICVRCTHLLKS